MFKSLLFVIFSSTVTSGRSRHSGGHECTQEQHHQMQTDFSECRVNFSDQFYNRQLRSICTLLDKELEICAEIWNQCHDKHEIQRMKAMHIERFLESNSDDPTIEKCQTVLKFRKSNMMGPNMVEESACSDAENAAAMDGFTTCTHNILMEVYEETQGLTSPTKMIVMYCMALGKISSQCVHHWEPCFAPGDQRKMLELEMENKKVYLASLSNGLVTKESLSECDQKLQDKSIVSPSVRDVSPTEPPLHPLPTDAPAVSLPYDQVDDYEYNYDNEYGRDTGKNNHNNVQLDEKDNIENDLSTGYDKLKHLLQHEETTSEDNTIALPKTDDTHRPAGVPAVASVEDGSGNSGSSPAAALSLVIILSAYLL